MSEQERANEPAEHVWDVETSAPPEEVHEEVSPEGHKRVSKGGYFITVVMLLSLAFPAFLEPWSLLIPVAIAGYGLAWAYRFRGTRSNAGLVATIIGTALLMMIAGFIAMQTIPAEAWSDVLSLLFYAGWIILIPALTGIAFILYKQRGKRKTQ